MLPVVRCDLKSGKARQTKPEWNGPGKKLARASDSEQKVIWVSGDGEEKKNSNKKH